MLTGSIMCSTVDLTSSAKPWVLVVMSQAQTGSSKFTTLIFRQELSMTLRGTVTTFISMFVPATLAQMPPNCALQPVLWAAAFQSLSSLIDICIFCHQIRHHPV